jgi:hypothetical protein
MHTSYRRIASLPGHLGQTGVLAATEDGRLASGGKCLTHRVQVADTTMKATTVSGSGI